VRAERRHGRGHRLLPGGAVARLPPCGPRGQAVAVSLDRGAGHRRLGDLRGADPLPRRDRVSVPSRRLPHVRQLLSGAGFGHVDRHLRLLGLLQCRLFGRRGGTAGAQHPARHTLVHRAGRGDLHRDERRRAGRDAVAGVERQPRGAVVCDVHLHAARLWRVGGVITALIMWTAFASVFSLLLGYSRVPYAAALDGNYFKSFATLHPEGRFPKVSLLWLGGVAALFCCFSLAAVSAALVVIGITLQFLLQAVGLLVLR